MSTVPAHIGSLRDGPLEVATTALRTQNPENSSVLLNKLAASLYNEEVQYGRMRFAGGGSWVGPHPESVRQPLTSREKRAFRVKLP